MNTPDENGAIPAEMREIVQHPAGILSKPLSVLAWSRYFGERRATTSRRLEMLVDRGVAEQFAGRYQVRSSCWPSTYWADSGLLVRIAPDCATADDSPAGVRKNGESRPERIRHAR